MSDQPVATGQPVAVEELGLQPGVPDAFQRLWTPHRMVYIAGDKKPATAESTDCPFCLAPARGDDRAALIVHRSHLAYVILNLFPYSPGHLLICPIRHFADLTDASAAELAEISALSQQAIRVLHQVSAPHGFNLGINQGAVAGAGIASHLHQHVVPRWSGDANFLPVVAQTKAIPQLLDQAWQQLSAAWPAQ